MGRKPLQTDLRISLNNKKLFTETVLVKTIVLLGRKDIDNIEYAYIDYEPTRNLKLKGEASYRELKEWILQEYGVKVSSLYIAQMKDKCGIIERECYNKPKTEGNRVPKCPLEKEEIIMAAFKHFVMV